MPNEQRVKIKKFYQNSSRPSNYVPNALVTSPPEYPPVMSGLMQINPETKDIWISAGKELVSDWINVTGAGSSGTIAIQDNGTPISAAATVLNFVGATSVEGDPEVTVTIPVGARIFRSGGPGETVSAVGTDQTTFAVLIPGKTVKAESIVRITYRMRMISDPSTSFWTQPSISVNSSSPNPDLGNLIGYDRLVNPADGIRVTQMTRTIAVDKNTISYVMDNKGYYPDDNIQTSNAESPLTINWSLDQYIVFGIRNINPGPGVAQGVFYLIEIF